MSDAANDKGKTMGTHIFWDHLPFWFIMAAALTFAAHDIRAQITETGIYQPEKEADDE